MTALFQFLFLFQHEYDQEVSGGLLAGLGIVSFLFIFAIVFFIFACMWKIFTKAGKEGWAAIIPYYNVYVLLQIVGRPGWWLLLYLIPCVNIVIMFIVAIDLAKSFGKETGFAIGLVILPFIFYPILAFGDATYKGPSVAPPAGGTTL